MKFTRVLSTERNDDYIRITAIINMDPLLHVISSNMRDNGVGDIEDKNDLIALFINVMLNDVIGSEILGHYVDINEVVNDAIEIVKNIFNDITDIEGDLYISLTGSFEDSNEWLDDVSDAIITIMKKEHLSIKKLIGVHLEKILFKDDMLLTGIGYVTAIIHK